MTELESAAFLDDLFVAFPQTRTWLASCEDPRATRDIWIKVLTTCDTRDARGVYDDLLSGKLPMPEAYNRDQTPQIIRRYCKDRSCIRVEAERTKGYQQLARREADLDAKEHARAYFAMHWLLDNGNRSNREVDQVIEWTRGGDLPEFMEGVFDNQKPNHFSVSKEREKDPSEAVETLAQVELIDD